MKPILSVAGFLLIVTCASFAQESSDAAYLDPDLQAEIRATDLISRMTLEEKVLQMQSTAPAIPRLGVPAEGAYLPLPPARIDQALRSLR